MIGIVKKTLHNQESQRRTDISIEEPLLLVLIIQIIIIVHNESTETESHGNISLGSWESFSGLLTIYFTDATSLFYFLLNIFGRNDHYSYHNTIITFKFSHYIHCITLTLFSFIFYF